MSAPHLRVVSDVHTRDTLPDGPQALRARWRREDHIADALVFVACVLAGALAGLLVCKTMKRVCTCPECVWPVGESRACDAITAVVVLALGVVAVRLAVWP